MYKRQLRHSDNVLVNVQKNDQALFSGGATDLLPFCGQDVDVDGLLLTDDSVGAINMYLVQFIRPTQTEEWTAAKAWTDAWEAAHPDWAGSGRWYRRAGNILAHLQTTGYFGLGLERDEEIKAELYD